MARRANAAGELSHLLVPRAARDGLPPRPHADPGANSARQDRRASRGGRLPRRPAAQRRHRNLAAYRVARPRGRARCRAGVPAAPRQQHEPRVLPAATTRGTAARVRDAPCGLSPRLRRTRAVHASRAPDDGRSRVLERRAAPGSRRPHGVRGVAGICGVLRLGDCRDQSVDAAAVEAAPRAVHRRIVEPPPSPGSSAGTGANMSDPRNAPLATDGHGINELQVLMELSSSDLRIGAVNDAIDLAALARPLGVRFTFAGPLDDNFAAAATRHEATVLRATSRVFSRRGFPLYALDVARWLERLARHRP